MKFWLSFSLLLFYNLGIGQELEIRKAKVINYSTDNGWLNSLTVDMGVDSKGYVYYCNQKFERFDGAIAERINISDDRNDEFFKLVNIDSVNFLLCNSDCYIFNTQTQQKTRITEKTKYRYQPYIVDENYINIASSLYGEYLFDRNTKKIIQFNPSKLDDSYTEPLSSGIEKLLYTKVFYEKSNQELQFYDDNYMKIGWTSIDSKPINFTSDASYVLILTDRLSVYNKTGSLKININLPDGKHFAEFSDIKKFSNTEYLVNLLEGLFVFDIEKMDFTYEIRDIQNNPIIINEYLRKVISYNKTLHVLTHFSGHYRLQLQKNEVINFIIPESNVFVKTIFADAKNNRVFAGNQLGEFYQFDTIGNFIQKIKEINDQTWTSGIIKTENNTYLLCTSSSCYKLQFKDFRKYNITKVLNEDLGLYYSNTYTNNDTINIFTQINQIQFHAESDNLIKKKAPFKCCYQFQVNDYTINWYENSDYILINSAKKRDTIHLPNGYGGPICSKILNDTILIVGSRKGLFTLNLNDYSLSNFANIDDWIYAIELHNDILFCSTNQGIIIVKDGSIIKRITKTEGISSNEFNSNASFSSEDGRMFFGGFSGAISFYPETLLKNIHDIKTYPTTFKINGNRVDKLVDNQLNLAPGETNLSFRLSTLGSNPSLDYNNQYLIPKISESWIDVGKGNFINLTLSPGKYKVYYHSSTFFNPFAPTGESFKISVKEFWYKTNWFYGIILLLLNILLITFFISYHKFNSILQIRKLEAKEKLNSEKMRISRDLHDNLGTQMAMIGRNIDWLKENIDNLPEEVIKENLNSILEVSTESNQSLRDSIWAFKQSIFTAKELSDRTRHLIDRYRKLGLNITFEFSQKVETNHTISPSISLNIVRVVQESITNALKHSQCTIIRIEIYTDKENLYLSIHDNGIGFNPKIVSRGQGLNNIEDRADNIQALIKIESIMEVGTKILLQIKI